MSINKASDEQLRGVLAHEVAYADLGHVAQSQPFGAGMNIGIFILDQIIDGERFRGIPQDIDPRDRQSGTNRFI